jgi:cyanophycinase
MPGPIALIGGEGFTDEFSPALRNLLDLAGGNDARIVTLPTAAADDGPGVPEQRAKIALDFLAGIGAQVEAAMVLDKASANAPQMVAKVANATWIHLQGGQPPILRSILEGSAVWETILERHQEGVLLVGSSAGAVILGEHAFSPRRPFPPDLKDVVFDPMPGFNLLPGVAVGPHFNAVPPELMAQFDALMPSEATLVGVDEKTGLLGQGGQWEVIGAGRVTLIHDGTQRQYSSGELVPLYE